MASVHREPMEQQETFRLDVPQPERPDRWHPKITLFRLLTLGTTIALGTAKAVETYKQVTYVSVTLEWVLGVAAFLMYASLLPSSRCSSLIQSFRQILFRWLS